MSITKPGGSFTNLSPSLGKHSWLDLYCKVIISSIFLDELDMCSRKWAETFGEWGIHFWVQQGLNRGKSKITHVNISQLYQKHKCALLFNTHPLVDYPLHIGSNCVVLLHLMKCKSQLNMDSLLYNRLRALITDSMKTCSDWLAVLWYSLLWPVFPFNSTGLAGLQNPPPKITPSIHSFGNTLQMSQVSSWV